MEINTTKQKIFNVAVELFSEKGYSEVSIREIASEVGIKESSIYNHYKSKNDILEDIYRKFKECINMRFPTKKDVEEYISKESARELLNRLVFSFSDIETEFVIKSYRILCIQKHTSKIARDILMTKFLERRRKIVKYAFERLIEEGKIPQTDTEALSIIWTEAFYTRVTKITMKVYNGGITQQDEEEVKRCINFLVDIAVKGLAK